MHETLHTHALLVNSRGGGGSQILEEDEKDNNTHSERRSKLWISR